MNVVVINGSPRLQAGNTWLILEPFVEGLRQAGCVVSVIEAVKIKIAPCSGDMFCCVKAPGTCVKGDDMGGLLPVLDNADLWVVASPVYCDGISAQAKTILDRIVPLLSPTFELRGGHCRHPRRKQSSARARLVLVSSCGHWETDNFSPLVHHMKALARNANMIFAGALLRPHASVLKQLHDSAEASEVFAAARAAGLEIAKTGRIPKALSTAISAELVDRDSYINSSNAFIESLLAKGRPPRNVCDTTEN